MFGVGFVQGLERLSLKHAAYARKLSRPLAPFKPCGEEGKDFLDDCAGPVKFGWGLAKPLLTLAVQSHHREHRQPVRCSGRAACWSSDEIQTCQVHAHVPRQYPSSLSPVTGRHPAPISSSPASSPSVDPPICPHIHPLLWAGSGGPAQVINVRGFLDRLNRRPGAADGAIAETERRLSAKLPAEYVEFVKFTNGGEGVVGKEHVVLWSIGELLSMNRSYEVQKYAPGLLVFGSNGAGEAYGFDTRTPQWPIVQVPFVGMEWRYARSMGESFSAFLKRLHQAE